MAHQHTHNDLQGEPSGQPDAEAIAKGYEPHDIGLRPIFLFIGGLVVTMIVVLAFIYAVVLGLADYDRTKDAIGSPVAVKLPPIYAPLQPSLGLYDNHDQDHDVLDWQDMQLMRQVTNKELNEEGVTEAQRHHIPINKAIDIISSTKIMVTKPAVPALVEPTYPAGSYASVYVDQSGNRLKSKETKSGGFRMETLNENEFDKK